MKVPPSYCSVAELADQVPDGVLIGIPKEDAGSAMELARALVRRGIEDLHLITVPVGSLQADLLIGAGCVSIIETSGVSLGETGFAPHFRRAVENQTIIIRDATCPAIYAALQASEKGIPFMPLRGIIGSDVLSHRDDWLVINNPFAGTQEDPLVLLPAIRPDIAMFHAPFGDRHGNVWVGSSRECTLLAHASAKSLVTVETIWDGNLMDDPHMRSATIPPLYIDAVALAPKGAWPLGLKGVYARDAAHLRRYVEASARPHTFDDYLGTITAPLSRQARQKTSVATADA